MAQKDHLQPVRTKCEAREGLDIIKPQEDARYRVMRYKGGNAPLDDIRMYISPQASYTFNDIPILRLG